MKISTTLFLLTTAFAFTAPYPSPDQKLGPIPAVCTHLIILRRYIKDLNTFPTQSDIYMAQAQTLTVDDELQCPTKNGILDSEEPASDACKKNQELKDAIGELRFSSSEDKRLRLKGLIAAITELSEMSGCFEEVIEGSLVRRS